MTGGSFSLQPFPAAGERPAVRIDGEIHRRGPKLAIRYTLRGRLAEVAIAGGAVLPARRHGLWEETCFEFFLAPRNSCRYWEFNLSPEGHWNVYRFEAYRQGVEEEKAFDSLPFEVRRQPDSLALALELEVERIIRSGRAIEAAVSAVLKLRRGEATYWALAHGGTQPDFHRRDGFIIRL